MDDVGKTLDRLLELAATMYEQLTPGESGFVTASVRDPFGNLLGVLYNPHYLEMLDA